MADTPITKEKPIGDMLWAMEQTCWSHDKISRLCRKKVIPGCFKAQPNEKGSTWNFRKSEFLAWFNNLGKGPQLRRHNRPTKQVA
jgi:hypothetical protein